MSFKEDRRKTEDRPEATLLKFDIIIVGAGHAGVEAALAASRLGGQVGLITLRADRIAQMSCNPAIGGVGKGQIVREIDAMGGAMGKVIDATGIHFKRLNMSRGAAARSTRAQADSKLYREKMSELIFSDPNITLIEDEIAHLLTEDGKLLGVYGKEKGDIFARAVVITTGTFLNGLCHIGDYNFPAGRIDDKNSYHLSDSLRKIGLVLGRFKTGTTPRLAADSINYSVLEPQPGDSPAPKFSFDPVENNLSEVICHITHTNKYTHTAIMDSIDRSPLFAGVIEGTGPRYCPSIEDKVVRFSDKGSHQIFLEPEGLDSDLIYPNGISTSLPKDVQDDFVHSIPGLEKAKIIQYGYAVEYDYAPPTQLHPSLATKVMEGLYLAGQINGTSGYEEAGAQGLIAGLNAMRFIDGKEPVILGREQAYMGVMIDDLVTRGVDEPYRMFTSRAEHRLVLRESNAEARLWPLAAEWGLLSAEREANALRRHHEREDLKKILNTEKVGRERALAKGMAIDPFASQTIAQILRRPEATIADYVEVEGKYDRGVVDVIEEEYKYAGYIKREKKEIERLAEVESYAIAEDTTYWDTPGLSREIQEKLEEVKPVTLGQASRIPGMTPAALAILRISAHRVA